MRFDDRLKTVLGRPATDAHDRAVRWRQLVELLARASGPRSELTDRALDEVRSEAATVGEQLRAATARAVARPQLPLELVQLFAADNISVSAPVLAAASLEPDEWTQIVAAASPESRRFIRALHPALAEAEPTSERPAPEAAVAEPVAAAAPETVAAAAGASANELTGETPPAEPEAAEPRPESAAAEPPSAETPTEGEPAEPLVHAASAAEPAEQEAANAIPSIAEMLARIERLRQGRGHEVEPSVAPEAPEPAAAEPGAPTLFRWECGPSGEIAWVEGAPRGALIGRSLAVPGEYNGVDERIQRAFAVRAPFRDARLVVPGEGIAAGEWTLSGVPAFERSDGRFAGYRGVATRAGSSAAEPAPQQEALDHDSLRELVHEIKTPLNAIIGFAEIIDGQYLGPADHVYRERAAEIVAQARLLLAAIEDLDLAAQLRTAPAQAQGSTDLKEVLSGVAADLKERAARRGAQLGLATTTVSAHCAIDRALAERLVRRFCGAIVDSGRSAERLTLELECDVGQCVISAARPDSLRGLSEAEIFASGTGGDEQAGGLATGLSLRLARTLAQLAGGDVRVSGDRLTLILHRERR